MSTIETSQESAIKVPTISWEAAGVRMSVAEFDAIQDYDELYRYELIQWSIGCEPDSPRRPNRGPMNILAIC